MNSPATISFGKNVSLIVLTIMLTISGSASANERSSVLVTKGSLILSEGKIDRAIQYFEKALQEDPTDLEAQFYLSLSYSRSNDFNTAEIEFKTLLDRSPDYDLAYLEYGIVLINLGKYEQAIEWLEKANDAGADAGSVDVYYYLGYTNFELGAYDDAIDFLTEAIKLDDGYTAEAYYFRGVSNFRIGYTTEAAEDLKKAAELGAGTEIETSSKNFIAKISSGAAPEAEEPKLWRVNASLSAQYDSNVSLWPEGRDTPVIYADLDRSVDDPEYPNKGDMSAVFTAGAGLNYKPKKGFRGSLDYNFYQNIHIEMTKFDVTSHTISASLGGLVGNVLVSVPISAQYTFLDIQDLYHQYSSSYTIMPTIAGTIGDSAALIGRVGATLMIFPEDPGPDDKDGRFNDRDAINIPFSLGAMIFFDLGHVDIIYNGDYNEADGDNWDSIGNSLNLGLSLDFESGGAIRFDGYYLYRMYLNDYKRTADDPLNEKRTDSTFGVNLGYTITFVDYLKLGVGVGYTNNTTSPGDLGKYYSYDRLIAALSLGVDL